MAMVSKTWLKVVLPSLLTMQVVADPLPIVMDMVHHNPGEKPFESRFLDPAFLSKIGMRAKVVNDFKAPQCVCTFEDVDASIFPLGSQERKWIDNFTAECETQAAMCHQMGIMCYYFMDIIVLPRVLIKKYAREICDENGKVSFKKQKTWEIHRAMLREMLRRIPSVDGYVVRTGEMYSHNMPYHGGNTPFVRQCGLEEFVEIHSRLINLLREEICEVGGKKIFYRTWDFGLFHERPELYLDITGRIEPHANLYFSIKHTAGDYLRLKRFNRTLAIGRHRQVVEVQCQREYEGKGAYPNYVIRGVLEGFEENLGNSTEHKGVAEFLGNPLFAGVWSWSRGGGWEGPYLKNELWCELNAYVLTQWALRPEDGEKAAFSRFMEYKGVAPESRENFRKMALLSTDAVVRGMGFMPKERAEACWTRDHFIAGFGELKAEMTRFIMSGLVDEVLANHRKSVEIWEEIVRLARTVRMANKNDEQYVVTSAEYGLFLYRIYEAGWSVLLKGLEGDIGGTYDLKTIASAIKRYDAAWADYRALSKHNPDCATLFDGCFARYRISPDHNSIEHVPGMDADVSRYRKLVEVYEERTPVMD